MSGVVLVTGGTGFLGTQVCLRVLHETDHSIVALVRAKDHEEAARRLGRAWFDWPRLTAEIGRRVRPLASDISEDRLGRRPSAGFPAQAEARPPIGRA